MGNKNDVHRATSLKYGCKTDVQGILIKCHYYSTSQAFIMRWHSH